MKRQVGSLMSRIILISIIIILIVLAVLSILFWLQRNAAWQQLALMELTHATTVAEVQSTMTAKIHAQATVQAEVEMAQATAVSKIEMQATGQAETDTRLQETEARYQAALAQKLGAQAQLRLNDTTDSTLGTLLAVESLRRFQSIEGDVAIRRGIELLSWRQVFTAYPEGCAISISLSDDGKRAEISSHNCRYSEQDAAITVWDVNTNQQIIQFIHTHDEPLTMGSNLSPDGRWLAIHYADDTLKVIAVDTGQQVLQVISADWDFSPDSQRLAFISDDNMVSIWDTSTMQVQTRLSHKEKVEIVNFSPDGRWIITRGEDKIWLWETENGKLTHEIAHKESWVRFSPDSRWLAIVDYNNRQVHLWDVVTGQDAGVIAQGASIQMIEFNPDGRWLATLSQEGSVQVWDVSSGIEITRIPLKPSISAFAFSPDGRWLATSVQDGATQLWATDNWQEAARIARGGASITFAADGKRLALVRYREGVQIWDIESGPEVAKFSTNGDGKFAQMAFSPNGQWIAAIQEDEAHSSIQVWDMVTGRKIAQLKDNGRLARFVFSPDGQRIVAGDSKGAIVWDVATGQEVSRMTQKSEVNPLAFSPDGQWIVSSGEGKTKIWDVTTGSEIASLNGLAEIRTVIFSPDSHWVAIGTPTDALLWNVTTHQEVAHLAYNNASIITGKKVAFSPDSRLLAVGDQLWTNKGYQNIVRIWDVATQQEIRQLSHKYIVSTIAFSPDGRLLATGTNQIYFDWAVVGEIRIWDVETGQEIAFIDSGPVNSLSFSSDSRWLVRGDKIWEANTGREVAHLSYKEAIQQAALSPDGRWLATANDEHISIWAWQPADMITQACARLARNLTKQEWRQYLSDEPYRATCPDLPIPQE